jgi:uncharacterized protein YbbC (DUF1343 family)
MTMGECAFWIVRNYGLQLKLDVVKVVDWSHGDCSPWINFIPPSPAIRSWDSAAMYPATVFTEAYPAVDCDRYGPLAFRVIGAPWLDAAALMGDLGPGLRSCGIEMRPYRYRPQDGTHKGILLDGILLSVCSPEAFYPVTAGILMLTAILHRFGDKVFLGGRDEWFDKLYGTDEVRSAVLAGEHTLLFSSWLDEQNAYLESKVDLY